jgi:ParB family chromosome partitioning protein
MPELVTLKTFIPALPLDQIDVSDNNVRKTQLDFGIEELKASIEHLGLIQPVVVVAKGARYQLIVGQRRYRAFQALNRNAIPALVIGKIPTDSQILVSFSENIHRRDLPYDDTIKVCDYLFSSYSGKKTEKLAKIARDLNISISTVRNYLAYKLVPENVQKLVRDGNLPAGVAYRITEAFWPNIGSIEEVAKRATRLTTQERKRIIEIARKNPEAPVDQIIEDARKAFPFVEVSVFIEPQTMEMLRKEATRRDTDVKELIKTVVEEWVQRTGLSA